MNKQQVLRHLRLSAGIANLNDAPKEVGRAIRKTNFAKFKHYYERWQVRRYGEVKISAADKWHWIMRQRVKRLAFGIAYGQTADVVYKFVPPGPPADDTAHMVRILGMEQTGYNTYDILLEKFMGDNAPWRTNTSKND